MQGDRLHPQLLRLTHGVGHGLGNVAELQIQKNPVSGAMNQIDGALAVRGEQLQADFIKSDGALKALQEFLFLTDGVDIQGNDHLGQDASSLAAVPTAQAGDLKPAWRSSRDSSA